MPAYALELRKNGLVRMSHEFVGPELRLGTGPDDDCRVAGELLGADRSVVIVVEDSRIKIFGVSANDRGPLISEHRLLHWFAFGECWLRVKKTPQAYEAPSDCASPAWIRPEIRIKTAYQTHVLLLPEPGNAIVIGSANAESDFVVRNDPRVSAKHTRISHNADFQPMVEDLGSHHGTFVNTERLTGPHVLRHGDVIRLGATVIAYTCYADVIEQTGMTAETNDSQSPVSALNGDENLLDSFDTASELLKETNHAPNLRDRDISVPEDFSGAGLLAMGHTGSVLVMATAVLMCLFAWITVQVLW